MIRVKLEYNPGFAWYEDRGTYVKGYLYHEGEYLEGRDMAGIFRNVSDEDEFLAVLQEANGCFSVILKRDRLLMACDPLRVFPLFYSFADGDLHVSDNANNLRELRPSGPVNTAAITEFGATGYVTGKETLFESVFQVQAGEIVCGDGTGLSGRFYATYQADAVFDDRYGVLMDRFEAIIAKVGRRLVQSLKGRTAVIPLSGGFDSRLVAVMLKQHNYPHVLCFTYGRPGNPDLGPSEIAAQRLGYPWVFIEYTGDLIRGYLDDPEFHAYYPYSANATGMFFMQEYFAVRHLRDHRMVPGDAVFVPGHSGDFLAGSMFLKQGFPARQVTGEKTVRKLYDFKCIYSRPSAGEKRMLLERIRRSLAEKSLVPGAISYTVYEDWDLKEKIAKFIVNSCNVYSFFGYQYRFPLWDRELMEFFRQVPFAFRVNKKLYDEVLVDRLFAPFNLNLENEVWVSAGVQRRAFIKSRLKKCMPFLKRKPPADDALFYHEITGMMQDDLRRRGIRANPKGGSHNSLIIQWYIDKIVSRES